jgi:hypothetical protein
LRNWHESQAMTGKGGDLSAFDGFSTTIDLARLQNSIQDGRAKDSAYCTVLLARAELSDRRGARLGEPKKCEGQWVWSAY